MANNGVQNAPSEIQEEMKVVEERKLHSRSKSRMSLKTTTMTHKTKTTTTSNRFREPDERQKAIFDSLAEKVAGLSANKSLE